MAGPQRNPVRSVSEILYREAYRFSFVQVVRLLELIRLHRREPSQPLGLDAHPQQECVRIEGVLGRSFPAAEVSTVTHTEKNSDPQPVSQPLVSTTFMGLYGPCGVLPQHDNQRIIWRGNKVNAEKSFLDLFHHRILSLFYRAAVKYRLPIAFEKHLRDKSEGKKKKSSPQLATQILLSTAGLGFAPLQHRHDFPDELAIIYSQYLGQATKNSSNLKRMLESIFQHPVQIQNWTGRWLRQEAPSQTMMPCPTLPSGQYCQLGMNFVLGDRVWDVQGKFRVRIGPMNREAFNSFQPGTKNWRTAMQLIRYYAGAGLDFDLQLEIQAEAVPELLLDGNYARLGLNSWLISQCPTSNKLDAVFPDPVFQDN